MSNILKDMSGLYSNLKVNPSRKSGTIALDNRYGLRVDEDQKPDEWVIFDSQSGDFAEQNDVPQHAVLIKSFVDDWEKLSGYPAKDPLDNLKAGGFELSATPDKIDEAELKTSDEEEKKIIEMERMVKEAEAEFAQGIKPKETDEEEENARKREENERILAEMEKFEQEKPQPEEPSKKPEPSNTIYSPPEDVFETAPTPKKGVVKLLDIIYDLVEDDLVQFFGKTGTCKTSISIQAALEARESGKSVYYLDTEKNISRKKRTAMKDAGVIYMPYTPSNMTGEFKTVNDLIALHEFIKKIQKVDVLIIDSLGLPVLSVFCEGNQRDQGLSIQKMINISKYLKSYANKNRSLVIVINQPESDMNKDPKTERRSFGEKAEFYYKELLKTFFVEKKDTKTTVVVKTYRSRDYGQGYKLFTIEITNNGVKVIQ